MRTTRFLSWVGAACIVVLPATQGDARPSTPQSSKFTFDVTVKGKMPRVSGGLSDLFLTFSEPVKVPRADLPAGTYVFTRLDPGSSAIRVTGADRSTLYALFLSRPASRTGNLDNAQIRFVRDAPGEPPRILEVYPPGTSSGYAPIYSRRRAAPAVGASNPE